MNTIAFFLIGCLHPRAASSSSASTAAFSKCIDEAHRDRGETINA